MLRGATVILISMSDAAMHVKRIGKETTKKLANTTVD